MLLLQLKVPLELIIKRRELMPRSGFLSRRAMTKAVERDIKKQIFFRYLRIILGNLGAILV